MDTKWISSTTSGVFSYFKNQITGEHERPPAYSSRNALCKGMWVKDLPTNNYEPIEDSHGARAMAKKYNREKELEEKIASLRAQCNAKNKEIACLQGKLSELQRNGDKKANDLTKKLEDKEQLMKKARKFVSVTKGKLLKKEEETQELSKELYSVKEREKNLEAINASLQFQLTSLQGKLGETSDQLQGNEKINEALSNEITSLKEKLSSNDATLQNFVSEKAEMTAMLNNCKEREKALEAINASLQLQATQLQGKLSEMSDQLQGNEKINEALSKEIASLKEKLSSNDATLQNFVSEKAEMTAMLNNCKEREKALEAMNTSLQLQVTSLQGKLGEMSDQLQGNEKINEALSNEITSLKDKLSSTAATLQNVVSEEAEMTAMLNNCKEREKASEAMNGSLQLQATQLQGKLSEMSDQLQENEKNNEALSNEIASLKDKLSSTDVLLRNFVSEKAGMTAMLNNGKEREKALEAMNASLQLQATQLQGRLGEMSDQLQGNEKINEALSNEITSLKEKLSSNDATLQNFVSEKAEMTAMLNNCKAEGYENNLPPLPIIGLNHARSVAKRPFQTHQAAGISGECRVSPYSIKAVTAQTQAECCDKNPQPSIVSLNQASSVAKRPVQTQQAAGISGECRLNPFSMKAARATQGVSSINLRPSSQCIPVANVIVREPVNRPHNLAEEDNTANPFFSIETQGFFSKLTKWFGF